MGRGIDCRPATLCDVLHTVVRVGRRVLEVLLDPLHRPPGNEDPVAIGGLQSDVTFLSLGLRVELHLAPFLVVDSKAIDLESFEPAGAQVAGSTGRSVLRVNLRAPLEADTRFKRAESAVRAEREG